MKRLLFILFTIHCSCVPAVASEQSSSALFTVSAQQKPCGTSVLAHHRKTKALHRVQREGAVTSYQGENRGLIILVDFPDQPFSDDDPKSQWSAITNERHIKALENARDARLGRWRLVRW